MLSNIFDFVASLLFAYFVTYFHNSLPNNKIVLSYLLVEVVIQTTLNISKKFVRQ